MYTNYTPEQHEEWLDAQDQYERDLERSPMTDEERDEELNLIRD